MKIFLLSGILLLGFFLRAQETLSGNYLFLKDQGRDLLAVKSLVVDKKPTLIGPYTGLQAVFQGPLYYYLLAVPFMISDGNPQLVMWLMLAASMIAIPLIYIIGKNFFSQEAGLFAAFLLSVSPAAAAAATFIWSPFFALPLSLGVLYWYFSWKRNGLRRDLVYLAVGMGLLFHFEIAFAFPFALVILFLLMLPGGRYRVKILSSHGLILLGVIFVFLSPLLLFDVRHNFITSRSVLRLLTGSMQGLSGGEPYGKVMLDHLAHFIIQSKSVFTTQTTPRDIFSFLLLIGSLSYGMFGKSPKIKNLIVMVPLMFAVYLLYPFQIYDWYLVGLFPVYALLAGIFFAWLWMRSFGRIIACVVIILLLQQSGVRLKQLYDVPDYGGTAKIQGKLDAIDRIYQDASGEPFNILVFTPVVLTDAYDYLTWWYGSRKYGFLPGKEKKGLVYLLIEPDPSKPWTYNGWLDTEIVSGTIISTQTFPSGFIVQKRHM